MPWTHADTPTTRQGSGANPAPAPDPTPRARSAQPTRPNGHMEADLIMAATLTLVADAPPPPGPLAHRAPELVTVMDRIYHQTNPEGWDDDEGQADAATLALLHAVARAIEPSRTHPHALHLLLVRVLTCALYTPDALSKVLPSGERSATPLARWAEEARLSLADHVSRYGPILPCECVLGCCDGR